MIHILKRKNRKKFTRENLEYQCDLVIKDVTMNPTNKKLTISTLQQISELIVWGDQNDDTFFDIISEKNLLSYFLLIIKSKNDSDITQQVLQTLSIIIENISRQQSLYQLFSNNYINNLIIHNFNFNDSDITGYYIVLLRQISSKLDENIINFFFNSKTSDFPLYVMTLKFYNHSNQTIRTKVMQIILYIFKICKKNNELCEYIIKQSAKTYFYNLIIFIRNECIQLNKCLNTSNNSNKVLENKIRSHIDQYYYLCDILTFKLNKLSNILINQLLSHLIIPLFISSLKDDQKAVVMDDQKDNKPVIVIQKKYWTCHTCTFAENPLNAIECQICSALPPERPPSPQPPIANGNQQINSNNKVYKNHLSVHNASNSDNIDNRISKELSIYLLTQTLTILDDDRLRNVIVMISMYKTAPKLVSELILSPPKCAVVTFIPIVELLLSMNDNMNTVANDNDIDILTQMNHNKSHLNINIQNRSSTMRKILLNDENNKIKRSKIESVKEINIISADSLSFQNVNIYRNSLLNILDTDPFVDNNEQLIGLVCSYLLICIRNKSVTKDILINSDICPSKLNNNQYPMELVECIINALSKYKKLTIFTIRVLTQLLIDLVQNNAIKNNKYNGLNDKHYKLLLTIWKAIKSEFNKYFPLNDNIRVLFIDILEEKWRDIQQQIDIEMLIAQSVRLLHKNDEKIMDDDLVKMHHVIRNFTYFSVIRNTLLNGLIEYPFVARQDFKYYDRLLVPLTSVAKGCISCLILYSDNNRKRIFFSTRQPKWLLLFNRVKNKTGIGVIEKAIPIHIISYGIDKLDPRIIYLTTKSSKYSQVTLFFDSMFDPNSNTNKDAQTAIDYIKLNKEIMRRKINEQITNLIDVDNNIDTNNN